MNHDKNELLSTNYVEINGTYDNISKAVFCTLCAKSCWNNDTSTSASMFTKNLQTIKGDLVRTTIIPLDILTAYQKSQQIQYFCSQALTTMPTYNYSQGDLDGSSIAQNMLFFGYKLNAHGQPNISSDVKIGTIGFAYFIENNKINAVSFCYTEKQPELWVATVTKNIFDPPKDREVILITHRDLLKQNEAALTAMQITPLQNNHLQGFYDALGSERIASVLKSLLTKQAKANPAAKTLVEQWCQQLKQEITPNVMQTIKAIEHNNIKPLNVQKFSQCEAYDRPKHFQAQSIDSEYSTREMKLMENEKQFKNNENKSIINSAEMIKSVKPIADNNTKYVMFSGNYNDIINNIFIRDYYKDLVKNRIIGHDQMENIALKKLVVTDLPRTPFFDNSNDYDAKKLIIFKFIKHAIENCNHNYTQGDLTGSSISNIMVTNYFLELLDQLLLKTNQDLANFSSEDGMQYFTLNYISDLREECGISFAFIGNSPQHWVFTIVKNCNDSQENRKVIVVTHEDLAKVHNANLKVASKVDSQLEQFHTDLDSQYLQNLLTGIINQQGRVLHDKVKQCMQTIEKMHDSNDASLAQIKKRIVSSYAERLQVSGNMDFQLQPSSKPQPLIQLKATNIAYSNINAHEITSPRPRTPMLYSNSVSQSINEEEEKTSQEIVCASELEHNRHMVDINHNTAYITPKPIKEHNNAPDTESNNDDKYFRVPILYTNSFFHSIEEESKHLRISILSNNSSSHSVIEEEKQAPQQLIETVLERSSMIINHNTASARIFKPNLTKIESEIKKNNNNVAVNDDCNNLDNEEQLLPNKPLC